MSRLFASIEDALQRAGSPIQIARAQTRRAIYFARHGAFERARAEAEQLRAPGSLSYGYGVAAANLVEAIVAIYLGDNGVAQDKLRRAEVLAGGQGRDWLYRLVIAWQVHIRVQLLRPEGVGELISSALNDVEPSEHDVLSRICSIVAVALHWSDRFDEARPWYESARLHAVAEGDELTIDANLHNVATARIHNIRLAEITSPASAGEVERAGWELESSINFDRLKQGTTMRWSLPLLQARLQLIRGDFEGARESLDAWLHLDDDSIPLAQRAVTRADLALCLAMTKRVNEATESIEEAIAEFPSNAVDDELAIAYFREHQVLKCAGVGDAAEAMLERSKDRLARVRALHQIFSKSLSGLTAP